MSARREYADPSPYLNLFEGVGAVANEARNTEQALAGIIQHLGTRLSWDVGHAFLAAPGGDLLPTDIWHTSAAERFRAVRHATMSLPSVAAAGAAARAHASGQSVWDAGAALDPSSPRSAALSQAGLHTAIAVPASIDGQVWAILELFSEQHLAEDARLILVLEQIMFQLSLVERRNRAQAALERANADLMRSNRELETFAAIASHDLQEPLRKIQAFGDRLETRYAHLLPEDGRMYLQRMRADAGRMQTLINDLLAYSRIGNTSAPFTPVDLARTVTNVLDDLDSRIRHTDTRIHVGELPVIQADASQMHQLMQNLIGNAIKFQRPDTPLEISISAARVEGNGQDAHSQARAADWKISIADNGIGFDPRHRDRIFHMFERLHGRDAYSGTGIGLAICRRIAERHSGTIDATGRPGEGATFVVTLPEYHPQRGA